MPAAAASLNAFVTRSQSAAASAGVKHYFVEQDQTAEKFAEAVEKTDAPDGEPQQDWYRYVLKNHKSTITGLRRGTHQHVCDYAAEYAEQLNARILFGSSRWSPNGSKSAPRNR